MAARGVKKPLRAAALGVIGALAALQIIRTAAVADREARLGLAALLWPSNPAVLTDHGLLSIATAAAHGGSVPTATRADIRRVAKKAPLSPEPFVVEAAIAATEGRDAASERLLLAARDRDPRSRGARFLLADRYLRTGRIAAGLIEMQALIHLQSRGVEVFGPALVAYARTPGAVPQLRAFFKKYPGTEAGVLALLALDPANADLVLALASNGRNPGPDWRETLVTALAASGQQTKAYAIWARLSRVPGSRGLFNPAFAAVAAPPPFNWQFPTGGDGVAEPDGKGGLEVLYYGRANAALARQLLLLRPGRYRLGMTIDTAGSEGTVHWAVRCTQDQKILADLPLRAGSATGGFGVPAGCEAQWLELQGVAGETPKVVELTIRNLRLVGGPQP